AGFIGSPSMNVLDGTVAGTTFNLAGGGSIALGALPPGAADGPFKLGVRPEHLRLDPTGVQAEVLVIETTGSETQVALRFGGADIVGVFRERISAKPGEKIGLAFDPATLHLFDPQSGKRIAR